MAEPTTKKKKGFFQRLAGLIKDLAEWVEETFSDPELSAEIRSDLGLDPANPATPALPDGARRARIDAFAAKEDVDEASLLEVVADLGAEVDAIVDFIEAARADQVDARELFATMFKLFALDVLRVRNPAAYALVRLTGLALDDEEFLQQLGAAALQHLVRGEGPAVDGEAWVQRLSMLGGVTLVVLAAVTDRIGAAIDAVYGWDPDPEDAGEAAAIASRALTVTLDHPLLGVARPALTMIAVPRGHGGPGMYIGATAGASLPLTVGATTYTFDIVGAGQFGLFVPFDLDGVRTFASFEPRIRVGAEPYKGGATDPDGNPIPAPPLDTPALVVGTTDGSRLEIGRLAYGVELSGEDAVFRLSVRNGKLVLALGKGDSFLRQLPGGNIEVPFEVSLVGSTSTGIHFEGGTRLRVNLPVSASLFGVFTTQFLELELMTDPTTSLDIRGGFSLTLGPFAASIDRVGVSLAIQQLGDGIEHLGDLVRFAPPRGIGLILDAGFVKGGGFLFIDSARGEYAGALELKFLTWSIKAIGVLSTKRPDGSDGWSLLLFVFGQFNLHIAFGIFWTGAGGMIGLHHRSDVAALSAGMRTGALDDVLFPKNPVADAPRIINRYRTLFPVAEGNLLIGPMLELSFSQPPIVFVRLGLIFDVRNALATGPATLSKVVLVGQVLVQLPPRDTGVPAILKLLIDVVGYYDGDTRFLLVRARLRDSFVGIEGFVKLDLSGELLVAAQFGPQPAVVLSAGGFHPRYVDLPARVPRDLDKLRVSFKLGPVSLSIDHYFAITPNSVQAGQKATLKADFGVAKIEASLGWDALLYLSPRFFFVVDLEFKAKVKAFGRTLASVTVTATLEGPDEWRFDGTFSFSILWWDKTVPFHEHFGEVRQAATGTASLGEAMRAELANPDNITVEAPTGANPVTLASSGSGPLAHPFGRLAVRQRAVPLGLRIERLGTRELAGGPQAVTVTTVALNDEVRTTFEHTTEQFSRGQYVTLSDEEKLTGTTFETFPAGVIVGSADYVTIDAMARDVAAGFETVRLDPEPEGLVSKWTTAALLFQRATDDGAGEASKLGAAARSERAEAALRSASPLAASTIGVDEPPLALVGATDLVESAPLPGAAATSPSLAQQIAAAAGMRVVERFEVDR
jgi:Family of unknown function (DUF6603)